jgi:hypothetical protein
VSASGRESRDAVRRLLADPARARTAVLAAEILGPPVALRDASSSAAPWSASAAG